MDHPARIDIQVAPTLVNNMVCGIRAASNEETFNLIPISMCGPDGICIDPELRAMNTQSMYVGMRLRHSILETPGA